MIVHFDRQGQPLTFEQWAPLCEDHEYGRVAITKLGLGSDRELTISTMWIGIDMNYAGIGPPIIFETMIFGLDTIGLDDCEYQRRYATEDAAMAGHKSAVIYARALQNPDNDTLLSALLSESGEAR